MSSADELARIGSLLVEKYGERGAQALERLKHWSSGAIPFAYPEILFKHLDEAQLTLVFDAFWQVLPFGTGGRRGPVGYGSNRLNPSTVVLTVQGHCDYLRKLFGDEELSVVVANDVRVFNDMRGTYRFLGGSHPLLGLSSRALAKLACEVYAGNGIRCYIAEPASDAVLSTPELSFLISELKAAGGVNISASHNPPDDNGIKVYDQFGSQPVAPDDQHLVNAMEAVTGVRTVNFAEALQRDLVRNISEELHRKYVDAYVSLYGNTYTPDRDVPIVFTPMCGCGLTSAGKVLTALGFPMLVPPEEQPDGTFKVIPFRAPNPEVPQATEPAKRFADQNNAGIVLSSDPDADRVGLEIKLKDGTWYHFDGNQIAAVLCYFLMLDKQGPRRKGLVIETLVTTKILGRIVELAGDSWVIDSLLVGFKYVAAVLKEIERTGQYKGRGASIREFVLAAEESHGVVMLPGIRDKDATPACMFLVALYQRLRKEGRTLLDYYLQILDEVGGFSEVSRSIVMSGAAGVFRRDKLMAALRESPPESLNGLPVRKSVDYWDQDVHGPFVSETDKLPRNVIQYFLDTYTVTVRPSGTEPKLKLYCQLLPEKGQKGPRGMDLLIASRDNADSMIQSVYRELLKRIGIASGPILPLLPDMIEIDYKEKFERDIVPELKRVLTAGSFKAAPEALEWLRSQVTEMLPGTDPLPGLKTTVMYLSKEWKKELGPIPLLDQLEQWARS